ncbi:hypothetical protein NIES4103_59420 [Nostoc sp. NIES-4103]|nr:hypothetical protein NIES4103_59420 [Nostoc sp. NIES-4103]
MENFQPTDHLPTAGEQGSRGDGEVGGFGAPSGVGGQWGDGAVGSNSFSQCPMTTFAPLEETPRPQWLSNSPFPIPNSQSPTSKSQLLLYLIPVIGFFPSLWTLYRRQGNREQLSVCRLSITLAFTWLLGYVLLATGAETSGFFTLRLLILNSFFTSGYFLVSVWLMFRLMQGKFQRLPGFSNFAERVLGKYLP